MKRSSTLTFHPCQKYLQQYSAVITVMMLLLQVKESTDPTGKKIPV
jgi:hypothetical protein